MFKKKSLAAAVAAAILAAVGAAQAEGVAADMTTETFGDWMVRCVPAATADAPRLCEMTQELNESKSGKRVLAIGLTRQADGSAAATIVVPLGLKLSAGLALKGDGDLSVSAAFDTCLPAGCILRPALDAATVAAIGASQKLTASMTAPDGKTLEVALSSAGFTDAWARLALPAP